MKKAKRIFAGMAAAVMAFSTMSIGANAYQFTDTWQDLKYAPGLGSMIHTTDSARVQARVSGATITVNTTINNSGNTYMSASAQNASNSLTIYASGSFPIYFSSANFVQYSWKTVNVSIAGFDPYTYIFANGGISN